MSSTLCTNLGVIGSLSHPEAWPQGHGDAAMELLPSSVVFMCYCKCNL